MPNGIMNLALGLAMQVGSYGPSETPNYPSPARAFGQYGFEGSAEQRIASDSQLNWLHGYHQEIPAYGGHHVFRPYNYKDVLSQSQTAAGWGERPAMPYSQQFWHKYHDQATMLKLSRTQAISPQYFAAQPLMTPSASSPWTTPPTGLPMQAQQFIGSQPTQTSNQYPITMPSSLPDLSQTQFVQPTNEFSQLNYRK